MTKIGTLLAMGLFASTLGMACGGDEEDGGSKGPGEPCETDSECANGFCVVDGQGNKACAQPDDDGGGW